MGFIRKFIRKKSDQIRSAISMGFVMALCSACAAEGTGTYIGNPLDRTNVTIKFDPHQRSWTGWGVYPTVCVIKIEIEGNYLNPSAFSSDTFNETIAITEPIPIEMNKSGLKIVDAMLPTDVSYHRLTVTADSLCGDQNSVTVFNPLNVSVTGVQTMVFEADDVSINMADPLLVASSGPRVTELLEALDTHAVEAELAVVRKFTNKNTNLNQRTPPVNTSAGNTVQ